MKDYVLDTNVLLRFILGDVPKQKDEVEALFLKAKNNQILITIPQIVVFELDFILDKYYLLEKVSRIRVIKALVTTAYFTVESSELFITALSVYQAQHISFVDAYLYTTATLKQKELFTFDKKLKHIE